jgi:putative transposase
VLEFIFSILAAIRVSFRSRGDIAIEVLALRQQIAVLKRRRPRPTLNSLDRLFWTTLRRFWSRWTDVLVIVRPETVIGWHRAGYRLYWRWRSRPRSGRPKITAEIRLLIRRLAEENAGWGAPKIHGELLKLGFVVSERTVARYLRSVLHSNVTRHPTAEWVLQQLREAFPEAAPYRYVILDRDSKFDADVIKFLKATGLKPKRTSVQAPWQNGVAERWVGSCRREILDHVIALNEQHLRRLIRDYVNYYHDDRIHDSLGKDTPNRRSVERKPSPNGVVVSCARLGGLHHRYSWRQAA